MKTIFKVLFVIIYFSGCEKNDFRNQMTNDWPEAVPLEGVSILDQELGLLYVKMVDTLLVAVTDRDTLIHVYDKELNHVSSFGNKGRGPGEFAFPPVIQDVQTEGEITKAQYLISGEYDLRTFDVDEENGKIYGSSFNNDAVYLFDMNH